jgi:hypothetical protein
MSAWLPSSVLRVWLEAWRADAGLGPEAAVALTSYRGSARFGAAREAAQDRGDPDAAGLARTVLSVDALAMAQVGHGESALALLVALLEAPFAPHPLGAAPERFAARLAAVLGDDVAVQRFAARATALEGAFGDAGALAGVGSLLAHDDLGATLAADVPAPMVSERPPSTFVAQAADEASTRAYVVTVGHRRDSQGTRFELHRATLSDITDDHGGVPAIADLVLAFDADAAAMLERLDPSSWSCVSCSGARRPSRASTPSGATCSTSRRFRRRDVSTCVCCSRSAGRRPASPSRTSGAASRAACSSTPGRRDAGRRPARADSRHRPRLARWP